MRYSGFFNIGRKNETPLDADRAPSKIRDAEFGLLHPLGERHGHPAYADLGATITGPQTDLNLGLHTFVGSTPMDQAVIDTSAPATYHINYVATDAAGNAATSTRTVIVEANPSTISPGVSATSTPAAATTTSATTSRSSDAGATP